MTTDFNEPHFALSPVFGSLLGFTWYCIAKCFCTFAPGVEQHVDVISWVMCGNGLAGCATCFHRELISANDGCGWRIHWQLDSVAVLFHNSSLPTIILQVLHQRDDDMGSLWHCWQWPWGSEVRYTSPTREGQHHVETIADCSCHAQTVQGVFFTTNPLSLV